MRLHLRHSNSETVKILIQMRYKDKYTYKLTVFYTFDHLFKIEPDF